LERASVAIDFSRAPIPFGEREIHREQRGEGGIEGSRRRVSLVLCDSISRDARRNARVTSGLTTPQRWLQRFPYPSDAKAPKD